MELIAATVGVAIGEAKGRICETRERRESTILSHTVALADAFATRITTGLDTFPEVTH